MNETTEHDCIDDNDNDNGDVSQYLTFILDGEVFATEITRVREVLEYTDITPVPRSSEYMKGIINLRGSVVPVIDMRLQFGLPETDITIDTCIIIIEVNVGGENIVIGALTDSVREVIDLYREQQEPAPTFGSRINNDFIKAIGKASDDKFIIMLDIDKVFSHDRMKELETVTVDNQTLDNCA